MQAPAARKYTALPLDAEQMLGVLDTTFVAPLPEFASEGVKLPPTSAFAGRLLIEMLANAAVTLKDWSTEGAAA